MKLIRLKTAPSFPLLIKRPPKVRREIIGSWPSVLRLTWPADCRVDVIETSIPTEVTVGRQKFLKIEAEAVSVLAEVCESSGRPCRVWFSFFGSTWEASFLNGWNPKPAEPPKSVGEISKRAAETALRAAVKLVGGEAGKVKA